MTIAMSQQSYLYELLQRKNPSSALLNENFWAKTDEMDERTYKEIIWCLTNSKISEGEMLIQNYDRSHKTNNQTTY